MSISARFSRWTLSMTLVLNNSKLWECLEPQNCIFAWHFLPYLNLTYAIIGNWNVSSIEYWFNLQPAFEILWEFDQKSPAEVMFTAAISFLKEQSLRQLSVTLIPRLASSRLRICYHFRKVREKLLDYFCRN